MSFIDTLFENTYTVNKELYLDWLKTPIRKDYLKFIWIPLLMITSLFCLLGLIKGDIFYFVYFLLLTLFCVYQGFLRKKHQISRLYKNLANAQGCAQWERCIRITDCVEVIDGNTVSKFQWERFTHLSQNHNCIILQIGKKAGLRLLKDNFTKGSTEDFLQYIEKNHPNITIK